MRRSRISRVVAPVAGAACMLGWVHFASAAVTYPGNGANGFGGVLGHGSVTVSDNGAGSLTATFNPSGTFNSNDVVVYIDSVPGGFADTSTFSDNGDGGREAISSENSGNPSRNLITFPTGFQADYALEFENNIFTGLFGLASGGNNSLNFITGATPTSGGPYTVTFPLADIGLTQGQSFSFVGDLISTTAFGSNESLGTSTTPGGTSPGFSGGMTFSTFDTYATTPVPEPAAAGIFVAAGGLLLLRNRRRLQHVKI